MDSRSSSKVFHWKVLLGVLAVLFAWLLLEYASLLYKSYQIEQKKEWFFSENDRLKTTNVLLAKQYEYFKTDYFFEKEAKRKLNKKNTGEKVAVMASLNDQNQDRGEQEDTRTMSQRWWDFFFL